MIMNTKTVAVLAALILVPVMAAGQSDSTSDGKLQKSGEGIIQAWDAQSSEWVAPVEFWNRYANRRGGLTWGRRADYPPYAEVNEFDTLIIDTPKGPCLMEFFHTRWRRANDVRRWDDEFNKLAGCPYVFD